MMNDFTKQSESVKAGLPGVAGGSDAVKRIAPAMKPPPESLEFSVRHERECAVANSTAPKPAATSGLAGKTLRPP
jgi:hypothetical protein